MRRNLTMMLCLSLALVGCKAKELADKASIAADLSKRGTTDLMKEVSNDEYTAPEDGRLTEAQVQMYLKVREHEKKITEVAKVEMQQHAKKAEEKGNNSVGGFMEGMKALGSAADVLTADIRAAKDLGFNTQEYLWVKQQILAASTAQIAEQFNAAMTQNFEKAFGEAKRAHDEAKDETTRKMYADVLAGYEKQKAEVTSQQEGDPAAEYNKQLLSKHENALNAFAHEIAKWEQKPGEAQKAVDAIGKIGEEKQ